MKHDLRNFNHLVANRIFDQNFLERWLLVYRNLFMCNRMLKSQHLLLTGCRQRGGRALDLHNVACFAVHNWNLKRQTGLGCMIVKSKLCKILVMHRAQTAQRSSNVQRHERPRCERSCQASSQTGENCPPGRAPLVPELGFVSVGTEIPRLGIREGVSHKRTLFPSLGTGEGGSTASHFKNSGWSCPLSTQPRPALINMLGYVGSHEPSLCVTVYVSK